MTAARLSDLDTTSILALLDRIDPTGPCRVPGCTHLVHSSPDDLEAEAA